MKKKFIVIIFIITIVFAILTCFNSVKADINDIYDPITNGDNPLYKPAEIITGAIKWIGVAILIGTVILKGIKYVTVSPEGKAEIKKDMVMLTIGAVLLFSFVTLVEIVYDFVNDSDLNNASLNTNSGSGGTSVRTDVQDEIEQKTDDFVDSIQDIFE